MSCVNSISTVGNTNYIPTNRCVNAMGQGRNNTRAANVRKPVIDVNSCSMACVLKEIGGLLKKPLLKTSLGNKNVVLHVKLGTVAGKSAKALSTIVSHMKDREDLRNLQALYTREITLLKQCSRYSLADTKNMNNIALSHLHSLNLLLQRTAVESNLGDTEKSTITETLMKECDQWRKLSLVPENSEFKSAQKAFENLKRQWNLWQDPQSDIAQDDIDTFIGELRILKNYFRTISIDTACPAYNLSNRLGKMVTNLIALKKLNADKLWSDFLKHQFRDIFCPLKSLRIFDPKATWFRSLLTGYFKIDARMFQIYISALDAIFSRYLKVLLDVSDPNIVRQTHGDVIASIADLKIPDPDNKGRMVSVGDVVFVKEAGEISGLKEDFVDFIDKIDKLFAEKITKEKSSFVFVNDPPFSALKKNNEFNSALKADLNSSSSRTAYPYLDAFYILLLTEYLIPLVNHVRSAGLRARNMQKNIHTILDKNVSPERAFFANLLNLDSDNVHIDPCQTATRQVKCFSSGAISRVDKVERRSLSLGETKTYAEKNFLIDTRDTLLEIDKEKRPLANVIQRSTWIENLQKLLGYERSYVVPYSAHVSKEADGAYKLQMQSPWISGRTYCELAEEKASDISLGGMTRIEFEKTWKNWSHVQRRKFIGEFLYKSIQVDILMYLAGKSDHHAMNTMFQLDDGGMPSVIAIDNGKAFDVNVRGWSRYLVRHEKDPQADLQTELAKAGFEIELCPNYDYFVCIPPEGLHAPELMDRLAHAVGVTRMFTPYTIDQKSARQVLKLYSMYKKTEGQDQLRAMFNGISDEEFMAFGDRLTSLGELISMSGLDVCYTRKEFDDEAVQNDIIMGARDCDERCMSPLVSAINYIVSLRRRNEMQA